MDKHNLLGKETKQWIVFPFKMIINHRKCTGEWGENKLCSSAVTPSDHESLGSAPCKTSAAAAAGLYLDVI